jgi:hypothetical protein
MVLYGLLGTFDQANRRQNEKSAGEWGKSNVSEVVAQQDEHRYQAETKPTDQAAQPFAETHRLVSRWQTSEILGSLAGKAVLQVTWEE